MQAEHTLAEFVTGFRTEEIPPNTARTARRVLLAVAGTSVAGAGEDGIRELYGLLQHRGGAEQARALVFGGSLPAHAASQFNGTLARALDFCDALEPGSHNGSSVVPAALAAAELAGSCSGADLLGAVVIGCEVGARMRLSESMYAGFDPTGVSVVFASTAAAARVLKLTPQQTLNALALAFNRCGGSFQSNIDGSLAVRFVQGWVAQTGIECAELAAAGITGPKNFLTGIYGFAQLFGRGKLDAQSVTDSLGADWRMNQITFKKYPSCGATQGMTELTLELVGEYGLEADDVAEVEVRINPYCHRLVGGEFRPGSNPRVDAQFNARYCVANALSRRASRLTHFRPDDVADADVAALISRIRCTGDPALDERGHSAVELDMTTSDGRRFHKRLDASPGFPGNELTDADHAARFEDCMRYTAMPLSATAIAAFRSSLDELSSLPDVRILIDQLISDQPAP